MRLRSSVHTHKHYTYRFLSPLFVLVFIGLVLAALTQVFPKDDLLDNIASEYTSQHITKMYLKNLLALYPNSLNLKLLLARQELGKGQYNQAIHLILPYLNNDPKTVTEWQTLLVYFCILRDQSLSVSMLDPAQYTHMVQVKRLLGKLATAPLSLEQSLALAEDAARLKQDKVALRIYQHVAKSTQTKPLIFYVNAAKAALAVGGYRDSAAFYFQAKHHATTLDDKRQYFISALTTLQQKNLLDEALQEAEKHLLELRMDHDTLVFLTRLALAANRPDLAQRYIKRALRMHSSTRTHGLSATKSTTQ